MKPWCAIIRMLSVLAILGLVLAPSTVPAVAGGMSVPMARAGSQMDPAADPEETMVEVPCCMPAWPSMPECPKTCPLAALCHANIVQGVSTVSAVLRWFSPAQAPLPGDDAAPSTLAQAPPSRPPRV
jgi:hypothetical protein